MGLRKQPTPPPPAPETRIPRFALGWTLRDRVTGFTGIATSRIEYMNGCVQYCLKPPMVDGKMPDAEYFDHQQLEFVDTGIAPTVESPPTGGPVMDNPPTRYRG